MDAVIDFWTFIEKTNAAKTADELFNQYTCTLGKLGFDLVLMSLMTDHLSIGKPKGHGIIRNYDESWMKYYTEKGYASIDPVRKQVMLTTHPFLWSQLNAQDTYTKKQDIMMNEAQDAGLKCGIGLGIHKNNREIAGFGVASSDGTAEINQNIVSLVKALTNQFHMAYTNIERKHGSSLPPEIANITNIESDILHYLSVGKSKGVISDIMGLNPNTLDYHLRNLYQKLGVNDKAYAVCVGARYGLINP